MPRYFEVSSPTKPLTSLSAADAVAGTMNAVALDLGVRIVAVRHSRSGAFIYTYSDRRRRRRGLVVEALRKDPHFADYEFSGEGDTAEGPFR
jgi:hypothetical protein